jgi:hypothetical protein
MCGQQRLGAALAQLLAWLWQGQRRQRGMLGEQRRRVESRW